MSTLTKCNRCELHLNQKPLIDKIKPAEIMWVGISAKKIETIGERPLSNATNSGKIIDLIESNFNQVSFYRTNLVKCLPLNDNKKLRYPKHREQEICYYNFLTEINLIKPKIVFLLGTLVSNFILKKYGIQNRDKFNLNFEYTPHKIDKIFLVPIHHPSYVYTYKSKQINLYVNNIKNLIEKLN